MALEAGARFGSHEVVERIGAGGMGEVYRATDTKLGRDVALKTLPAALAEDKARLARFEREAKLLAALNHPHIAAVYSLDEHEGTLYLAMELIEGETLEAKLERGALPVEDALRLALQIAEALEAAHDKGVVHRDLKPANVMVTADGVVKVLDFGLAKAFSEDPSASIAAHSPALSVAMTQQGLVLGTAGYMSPEQASGQPTDQRADIWGFGVLLFEMLTGLPLFRGESVPHILADVLKTEPDWSRLPDDLHPRIRLMLERCLEKKRRKRYHAIADARVDIEAALDDPAGLMQTVVRGSQAESRSPGAQLAARAGFVAAGAALATLVAWALWPPSAPAPAPGAVVRFSVALPADTRFTTGAANLLALSPDGKRIAYAADNQLYLRELAEPDARPVPGTLESGLGAATPVFSPDGQWLAYIAATAMSGPYIVKRVPISGGAPVPVHEATEFDLQQGLSWPTPDSMLFANRDGVVRIPANGGATEVLVPRADGERFHSPQLLPDGNTVLFTRLPLDPGSASDLSGAQVIVQSIGGDDRTIVWEGGTAARYVRSGHLVYAQGSVLYGIAFDLAARTVRGGAVQMAGELQRAPGGFTDAANFAISDTGTLAVLRGAPIIGAAGTSLPATTLTWVDRSGVEELLSVRPDAYTAARVSPDGTRIALVVGMINVGGATSQVPTIWLYDLRTENLRLLTTTPANGDGPVWSPDSNRVYFRGFDQQEDGVYEIGIYAVEVSTGTVSLIAPQRPDAPPEMPWSIDPDERTLALVSARDMSDINLATLALADGTFTLLLDPDGPALSEPSLAPNGQWIAYQSNDGGEFEVNVRPFPNVGATRIPAGAGRLPVFSRDGTELYFFDGQSIVAAPIEYLPDIRVRPPVRLFDMGGYFPTGLGRAWDVDPSGERFLMIRQPSASAQGEAPDVEQPHIDVVLNWVAELETRVPTH